MNDETWKASETDFASIIDAVTGKQIADFGSPQLSEAECEANLTLALAAPKMAKVLQRAEFLMRRASQGDYKAVEKLADAAKECHAALRLAGRSPIE